MSGPSVSVRDLAFVRDVLIPRVAYVSGPEVEALLGLKARLEAVFERLEGERAQGERAQGVPAQAGRP